MAAARESRAFYIGSLGRYTTQLSRYRQLVCEGYDDEAIGRVYGPIGLDLKGREPAEIALSVMAEITAVRHGGAFPMSTMLASARRAEAERADAEAEGGCVVRGGVLAGRRFRAGRMLDGG